MPRDLATREWPEICDVKFLAPPDSHYRPSSLRFSSNSAVVDLADMSDYTWDAVAAKAIGS